MPVRSVHRRLLCAAVPIVLVGAIGLAGCGSDSDDQNLVSGVTEHIDAVDNSFQPEEISVKAGTEIVFANRGRNDHNIVPVDDSQDFGLDVDQFKPGTTADPVRFTEPGTFQYFCSIHGTATAGMTGTITVTD